MGSSVLCSVSYTEKALTEARAVPIRVAASYAAMRVSFCTVVGETLIS
jgi:hypothetical protein